jgi:hypothetical protein
MSSIIPPQKINEIEKKKKLSVFGEKAGSGHALPTRKKELKS